jgi:ketosteroid isomerase-like protein
MSDTKEIITRMYAAAAAGEMAVLRGLFAEDFVIEEPPWLPYGGTYHGFEAFVGVFAEGMKVIDLPQLELRSLTVEDDKAFGVVEVPLVNGHGSASIIEEWTVRDGLVAHGRVFWFDPTLITSG